MLVVALLWGANFTINKYALGFVPPVAFSAVRFVLASAVFFALVTLLNPAPNTDPTNQGFFVVNNHTSALNTHVVLPGVFQAGQVLHFAYDIVAPVNASTNVLRTDVAGDRNQFAWDKENQFFAIEDTYLNNPACDQDYNDIVIGVLFNPVPAPGALALFGAASMLGRRRRRN